MEENKRSKDGLARMPFSKKRFSALLNQLNVPKADRELNGQTPETADDKTEDTQSPKLKRTEWWPTSSRPKKSEKSEKKVSKTKSQMPLAPTDPNTMEYPSVHYTNLLPGKIPKPKIKKMEKVSENVTSRLRRMSGGDAEGVLRLRSDSWGLGNLKKADLKQLSRKKEKKEKKKHKDTQPDENYTEKSSPVIAIHHDRKKIRKKRKHGDKTAGPIHFLRNLSPEAIRADDQLFVKFFKFSTCYDLQSSSAKLIIFDNKLSVTKAFYALLEHSARAAPIWDSNLRKYVGMFTITDFIKMLRMTYYNSEGNIDSEDLDSMLDQATFETWTEVLGTRRDLIFCHPENSLFDAIHSLLANKIHRLPVIDPKTGNILHIITHKRVLKYLYTYIRDLRHAKDLDKTATQLGVGTHTNLVVATEDTSIIEALNMFVDNRITAVPILDHNGKLLDMYARFDVINLAENHSYTNLDMPIKLINQHWTGTDSPYFHGIYTCRRRDTLLHIIEKMATTGVHRLFEVDDDDKVTGVIGLADVVAHLIHYNEKEEEVRLEIPTILEKEEEDVRLEIPTILIEDLDEGVADVEYNNNEEEVDNEYFNRVNHVKYVVTEEEVELDEEVGNHDSLELSPSPCSKLPKCSHCETVPDVRKPKSAEDLTEINRNMKQMTDFYSRLSPIPHSPLESPPSSEWNTPTLALTPSFNDKLLETVLDFRRMSTTDLDANHDPLLALHDPHQDPMVVEVKDPAGRLLNKEECVA